MEHTGADRPFRDADDLRRLDRRPPFDLAEHDGDPLIERKRIERAGDDRRQLAASNIALRIWR